jgi:putative ATP-binding cassette transporter
MKEKKYILLQLTLLLAAVTLLCFPGHAAESGSKAPLPGIETKIRQWMEEGDIPGLGLIIIKGDKEIYLKGFGYADLKHKTPVTPETLFELGSCSKAFTALAVLQLAEKGLIRLDEPVSRYLPWFYTRYQGKKHPVTLEQLLHHTSGIPWKTMDYILPGSDAGALKQTAKNIVGIELKNEPGKHFQYATINYDILGAIIEKVTGQSFEAYMENQLLKPLGLNHTRVGLAGSLPGKAVGYKTGFFSPREYVPPVYRGNNPAGYIVSNAVDLARWLKIQMNMVETGYKDLVQKSHQPDLSIAATPGFIPYAMGWSVDPYQNLKLYHGGTNPNFTSYIGFIPGRKLAVALMVNSNSTYTDFIGSYILKSLAGEDISFMRPSKNKLDTFFSLATMVLGLYIIGILLLSLRRFVRGLRGKYSFAPFSPAKSRRFLVALLMGIPFCLGIYFLPYAVADLSWKTALVWAPISFYTLMVASVAALAASYIYLLFTLVVPTKNKYKNDLVINGLLSIGSGLAGTFMLFLITTSFFSSTRLVYLSFYFGLAYLVHLGGRKLAQTKMIKISNHIALDLRIDLINKLIASRFQRFERIHDGRIFTTLNDDTGALSSSAGIVVDFIANFVTALTTFIYMTTISFLSTLLVLGLLTLLIFYYYLVSKRSRVFMEAARDSQNVYLGLLNGLIKGFKELALQHGKKFQYRGDLVHSTQTNCDKNITASIKFLDANIIGDSAIILVLGIVSIGAPRFLPHTEIYSLITFVLVIIYLLGPIRNILGHIQPLTQLSVSWNRIKGLKKELEESDSQESMKEFIKHFDTIKEMDPWATPALPPAPGPVEQLKIDGLVFQYEGEKEEEGFSIGPIDFEAQKGEVVFIVGGNGSGKTTLAKILTGLYSSEHGHIDINGKKIAENQLGDYFSTIYSDYHLFKKLYNVDLQDKETMTRESLETLGLTGKVEVKAGEYSTLDLSAGQKKRLALFQCFLENRPIYLFDELTADLDPEFRRFFYRDLLQHMKKQGKIIIAITHDDHYFDAADRLIKMDKGKIDYQAAGPGFQYRLNPSPN